jgi:ABC-type branched-subunit amino acid transport system substrate-binding protein
MKHLARRTAVLAVVATIAGLCAVGAPTAQAQAPTQNPFAGDDVFCRKYTPTPGVRNSSSPGVTPNSIVIAENTTDPAISARLSGGGLTAPGTLILESYIAEINDCGGINGRKIVLKHANNNPTAPDQVAMASALCLKITEEYKAFMVIQAGANPPFARCVSAQHKTITHAAVPGLVSLEEMKASKGRIFNNFGPGETLSANFIKYALKHNMFKGEKVMILGVQVTASSAAELTEQYLDPLKAGGVDAYLEVLPCIAGRCTAQVAAVVARAKSRGVDSILTSHRWLSGTIGSVWKNMAEVGLRARMIGPTSLNIHADAVAPGVVNDAGPAGTKLADEVGFIAYSSENDGVQGLFRIGYKETAAAKMCIEVVNRRIKPARPWTYSERDWNIGYGSSLASCRSIRAWARALWSVGPNLTTERAVTAISAATRDKLDGIPLLRPQAFYSAANPAPTQFVATRFHSPCPNSLPTTLGCMLPTGRPVRGRPF